MVHEIVKVALVTVTGSLKVMPTFAVVATSVAPPVGVVLATDGAASAGGAPVCEPSPSNVS